MEQLAAIIGEYWDTLSFWSFAAVPVRTHSKCQKISSHLNCSLAVGFVLAYVM